MTVNALVHGAPQEAVAAGLRAGIAAAAGRRHNVTVRAGEEPA